MTSGWMVPTFLHIGTERTAFSDLTYTASSQAQALPPLPYLYAE